MAGLPDRGYLTASEALTWLATGEALSERQLIGLYHCRSSIWGHWWPDRGAPAALKLILQALRARAGLNGGRRYCSLRFAIGARAILGATSQMRYVHRAVSPEGPALLRELRLRARRASQRLVSYAALAEALAQDIKADLRTDKAMKKACQRLRSAILAGTVVAYGQREQGSAFETIPQAVFLDETVTLSIYDRLFRASDGSAMFTRRRAIIYERVRFMTREIAALQSDRLSGGASDDSANSSARGTIAGGPEIKRARGRPTSRHLVMAELEHRGKEDELKMTLREEAEHLMNWLSDAHPDAVPIKRKTIENYARKRFRAMKEAPKTAPK